MKFKVGDIIRINETWHTAPYLNVPIEIKKAEGTNYYIDTSIVADNTSGYLFQEGSRWCIKAIKLNHYKTKLGRILYGKRY